jgi:subtilisin family serine protease
LIEQYYLPDSPKDSDTTGHDTDWTIHGVDIAAPGQNILGSFTGTSAAVPMVAATVALVRSLVPKMPVTTRTSIDQRIDTAICANPSRGVVEHILCGATVIPSLSTKIDGGRFLNVKNAVQAAHDTNQVSGGDINRDGVADARDIDLM